MTAFVYVQILEYTPSRLLRKRHDSHCLFASSPSLGSTVESALCSSRDEESLGLWEVMSSSDQNAYFQLLHIMSGLCLAADVDGFETSQPTYTPVLQECDDHMAVWNGSDHLYWVWQQLTGEQSNVGNVFVSVLVMMMMMMMMMMILGILLQSISASQ